MLGNSTGLLKTKNHSVLDSFAILIMSWRVPFIPLSRFRYFTALNSSDDPHFVNIRKALVKHPLIITETLDESINYLRMGGYIFPSQEDLFLLPIIQAECNLYYFKDGKEVGYMF